jgi:hypothetical protein
VTRARGVGLIRRRHRSRAQVSSILRSNPQNARGSNKQDFRSKEDSMTPSRTLLALLAVAGTAQAAELTLYKQPNFAGQQLTLRGGADDLTGRGFQDQTSSIEIQSGRWQVCTEPNFQGDCSVLERGRYPSLEQSLNHRIESARPMAGYARDDRGRRYADREYDQRMYGYDPRDRGSYDNGYSYGNDNGQYQYGHGPGYDNHGYDGR